MGAGRRVALFCGSAKGAFGSFVFDKEGLMYGKILIEVTGGLFCIFSFHGEGVCVRVEDFSAGGRC